MFHKLNSFFATSIKQPLVLAVMMGSTIFNCWSFISFDENSIPSTMDVVITWSIIFGCLVIPVLTVMIRNPDRAFLQVHRWAIGLMYGGVFSVGAFTIIIFTGYLEKGDFGGAVGALIIGPLIGILFTIGGMFMVLIISLPTLILGLFINFFQPKPVDKAEELKSIFS